MSSKWLPYPGQLPVFRFETVSKSNVAKQKHRVANRASMIKLRRRRLEEFDYEAYRADFSKRYISINKYHPLIS